MFDSSKPHFTIDGGSFFCANKFGAVLLDKPQKYYKWDKNLLTQTQKNSKNTKIEQYLKATFSLCDWFVRHF
jgi:hypothetical protein